MAVLRSSEIHGEPGPKIAFGLELLRHEKASNGEPVKDWQECRVWIEIFGQKIERPRVNTLHEDEIRELIHWLRDLTEARDPVKLFITMEPIFSVEAEPIGGPTFSVTVMITAYGVVPDYYVEELGVHVDIPTSEDTIREFAGELESELASAKS